VQTGVGRSGKLFAHEWAGVTPDVMAIAKGIGGSFPLGAVMATEEAAKGMVPGTHGSTFGGNPLAVAVGCAVLDNVLKPGFLDDVQQKALRLRQALAELEDKFPITILGVSPNPTNHATQIQFETSAPVRVVIDLIQMDGSLVMEIFEGVIHPGFVYTQNLLLEDYENGMYQIRWVTEQGVITKKVLYMN